MMKRAAVLMGIAFLALIRPSAPALAGGLVMSIDDVTGPTVGLGTFEVLLSNTEPSGGQSFDVASFSFQLMVPSSSGIQFTGATTSTSGASYIFDGTGERSIDPSFTLSPDPFPNAGFSGSDTEFTFASINVAPGDTFGLGFVFYAVQPGTRPATSRSRSRRTARRYLMRPVRHRLSGGRLQGNHPRRRRVRSRADVSAADIDRPRADPRRGRPSLARLPENPSPPDMALTPEQWVAEKKLMPDAIHGYQYGRGQT